MVSRFVSLRKVSTDWGPHRRADPHGKSFSHQLVLRPKPQRNMQPWRHQQLLLLGSSKTTAILLHVVTSHLMAVFLKTAVSFCFPCVLNWWWASNLRSRSKRFYSFLTGGCGSSRGWQTGLIYIYIWSYIIYSIFLNTVYYMLHIIMYIIYINKYVKHALYFKDYVFHIRSYHWYL